MEYFVLSLLITGLTFVLGYYVLDFKEDKLNIWQNLIVFGFYSFVLTYVNAFYGIYSVQSRKEQSSSVYALKQAMFHIIISLFLFLMMRYLTAYYVDGYSFYDFFSQEYHAYYLFVVVVVFVVLFVLMTIRNIREERKVLANISRSEYRALKNHIEPHFLFNNFNILVALIDTDPAKAQEFVIELSNHYRYLLQHRKDTLVALKEEIAFAHSYINLLKLRFLGKIVFAVALEAADLKKWILPLSIQELLQNALKHNRVNEEKPLKIEIYKSPMRPDYIVVRNTLSKTNNISTSSMGFGLEILDLGCKNFIGKSIFIEKDPQYFMVSVPLVVNYESLNKKR